jgi:hypothetical protein
MCKHFISDQFVFLGNFSQLGDKNKKAGKSNKGILEI